jgi:HlyD family secretion protein
MSKVKQRRLLVWGGIGLVGVVLLALALWPRPAEVDLGVVTRAPLRATLAHEGKTRVRERYEVSAPASGRILRIELEPGDPVRADSTVLAALVPSTPIPLDERSRAEAQAALAAARAALARAQAERDQAAARHDYAAEQWQRMQELLARGSVSQQRADAARTDALAAAQTLAAAAAAVQTAVHQVAEARAALLEPAAGEPPGSALTIRSPVDGVVLERLRQSAGVVAAGTVLLVVGDPSDLEVVSDYLSSDAVQISPGMRVAIEQWGGKSTLAGIVRRVEPHGFLKVSALGVEEQRVNVVSDFLAPRGQWAALGDGYRVQTQVITWAGEDVLQVETGALFRHGSGWAVFAVKGGRARLVTIELGHRGDLAAEVIDGLTEGDKVVLHPSDTIDEGSRVRGRRP